MSFTSTIKPSTTPSIRSTVSRGTCNDVSTASRHRSPQHARNPSMNPGCSSGSPPPNVTPAPRRQEIQLIYPHLLIQVPATVTPPPPRLDQRLRVQAIPAPQGATVERHQGRHPLPVRRQPVAGNPHHAGQILLFPASVHKPFKISRKDKQLFPHFKTETAAATRTPSPPP